MAPYHRITRIPIKDGSVDSIVAVANTPKFVEHMKTFVGFISVEVVADGTSHMITHSRWRDKETCDGAKLAEAGLLAPALRAALSRPSSPVKGEAGVAALGSVIKDFLSESIRGPPEAPIVGKEMYNYSPSLPAAVVADVGNVVGKMLCTKARAPLFEKKKVARRITHFALKPVPESLLAVLAAMNKPSNKKLFSTLDLSECVGFSADAGSFSICATYAAAASLPTLPTSPHIPSPRRVPPGRATGTPRWRSSRPRRLGSA